MRSCEFCNLPDFFVIRSPQFDYPDISASGWCPVPINPVNRGSTVHRYSKEQISNFAGLFKGHNLLRKHLQGRGIYEVKPKCRLRKVEGKTVDHITFDYTPSKKNRTFWALGPGNTV